MSLRTNIALLKEFFAGGSMGSFGGGAFPGPEPGKLHSTGTLFPGVHDDEDGNPKKPEKKRLRKAGMQREEPRWSK